MQMPTKVELYLFKNPSEETINHLKLRIPKNWSGSYNPPLELTEIIHLC